MCATEEGAVKVSASASTLAMVVTVVTSADTVSDCVTLSTLAVEFVDIKVFCSLLFLVVSDQVDVAAVCIFGVKDAVCGGLVIVPGL